MTEQIQTTSQRHQMLFAGAHVVAAVSGGADSMALLHALYTLREPLGFTLGAAHVHHGLRGEEADRDEALVRRFCEQRDIALQVHHADVRAIAKNTGEGLEEAGRRVRYAFFETLDADRIATAHTLDDRTETLLLNLTRGCGGSGLLSIPPVRGKIIRPLLDCTRAQVEAYCEQHAIAYATDSTNQDVTFARNRIRHAVVPQLQAINPQLAQAVQRGLAVREEEESYLRGQTQALLTAAANGEGYSCAVLQAAHPALRRRAIKEILTAHTGWDTTQKTILQLEGLLAAGGKLQLPGGTFAQSRGGCLFLYAPPQKMQPWQVPLHEGEIKTPAGRFAVTIFHSSDTQKTQKVYKVLLASSLDYDTIMGITVLRSRQPGDAIRLAGRGCTKTLKNLLQEADVPPHRRNAVAILADAEGPVWVQGFGCAERCRVTGQTERMLHIAQAK